VNLFRIFYVYIDRGWERRDEIMKLKIKIAIFLVAILVSVVGFNLITCSSCIMDMLNSGQVIVKVVSVEPNIPTTP